MVSCTGIAQWQTKWKIALAALAHLLGLVPFAAAVTSRLFCQHRYIFYYQNCKVAGVCLFVLTRVSCWSFVSGYAGYACTKANKISHELRSRINIYCCAWKKEGSGDDGVQLHITSYVFSELPWYASFLPLINKQLKLNLSI